MIEQPKWIYIQPSLGNVHNEFMGDWTVGMTIYAKTKILKDINKRHI